jgi:predicted GIY-YIG superfamily endonuclease
MAFWTYMLRCADGSYYARHTDDIDLRMAQHATGTLGGYTAKRRPVELVWSDQFMTRDEAFAAERKSRAGAGPRRRA